MILDFSCNNMNIVFEITEGQNVILKDFSVQGFKSAPKEKLNWCNIADLHITGGNLNDHHGAKHTGASENDSLKYLSNRLLQNKFGGKLEITLSNGKVILTKHYQFYKDISVIRAWSEVKNTGNEAVRLEYISSFAYTGLENNNSFVYLPHNSWCSELGWKKYSLSDLGLDRVFSFTTKKIGAQNTGSWSSKEYLPMGAFEAETNTYMWQIEANGSWSWEIGDLADMLYLKLSGPTEQENAWYKELKPGESFESVKAAITLGTDFDSALEQMTRYRRAIFENNKPNSRLPVIFNDYMNCLKGDPTTEKLLPIIDKAAEAGAEYFCVDAGWYADGKWWDTVGEWQPCEWRFPNGIKEVFDRIKAKEMVPGIWLEIEVMGINCPILKNFEDDCFFMRHGKKIIDHGRYQFDFRNKKVRDYATKVVDRVINEYGVGYIKFDYNIEAGLGTEEASDSFGDGLLRHNRALLKWIDEIKGKYPDLIIENCASGGMRMDYAMLSICHLQSVSDQADYRKTAVIAANYATAVLPEQAAVWSYPLADGDENSVSFNMINSMLSRVHLSGDIINLSEAQFTEVKAGIEWYKKLRSAISEFTPFYPLGLNAYENGFACVGYKAKTTRYLSVWKRDTAEQELFIPMKSPKEAKVVYPAKTKCRLATKQNGIKVTLPDRFSAVIIELSDDVSMV